MQSGHTEFPSTDFAITSINVGDRLDHREIDDRKQQEELYAHRRWGSSSLRWLVRLAPYLLLLIVIAAAGKWVFDQIHALAPTRIAQQLSTSLQVQVTVDASHLRATPSPAVVLSGVDLAGRIRLDEVALEFTAPNLWQAMIAGQRRWGDIVISPITVNFDQAAALLGWLSSLDRAVPDSVTKVRISEVHIVGSKLLPGSYNAATRRGPDGHFGVVVLHRLGSAGTMQLQVTPDPNGGPLALQLDASDFQPPFAPHAQWTEVIASGHVSAGSLEFDQFTMGSTFGAIDGHLAVRRLTPTAWSAEGKANSVGLDIPTLLQQLVATPGQTAPEPGQEVFVPLLGTASIDAAFSGTGTSLEDALSHLVAAGEVKVRNAALNGINLGYAASRPSESTTPSTGSTTRFTRLEALFVSGPSGVLFRSIEGEAGALSTRGELSVGHDLALNGLLHVNLGGTRIQAPLRIHVRGSVASPQFVR
ncbi:MAG: hypothetical protein JO133_02365 [Burkholderiaceae bacterium]|nr:hypothetical protein [Burkholderiaceae bacterium]